MRKGMRNSPLPLRGRVRERGSDTLLPLAKGMRKHQSDAERALWQKLRAQRLLGYKFRRQVVIEPYIVDFVCLEAKLIIEADGGQHVEQPSYDEQRTAYLEGLGYRVLRFWNHEILNELESVLNQIADVLIRSPLPGPLPEGEGM